MVDIPIFNLDDLVISPERLHDAKVFKKAVIRKPHEIIIPRDESDILIRDLKNSSFSKMADNLVKFYLDSDPNRDYISQSYYIDEYSKNNNFILPWLLPIVRDRKLVYKRKYDGPLTENHDSTYMREVHRNILNYANIDQSQVIVDYLRNYRSLQPTNMTNHLGSFVLRVKDEEQLELGNFDQSLEIRGSLGDIKITQLTERSTTGKRSSVITGKTTTDQVRGEDLQVIGFANLSLQNDVDWNKNSQIAVNPDKLNAILSEMIPNIGKLLEDYNTTDVTDFRVFLSLFEKFGHPSQSLTAANRLQISSIIKTNIDNIELSNYKRTDRLEYQYLEKELLGKNGSGVLSMEVMNQPAIMEYRVPFENYPHIFHRYLKLIGQLDNGKIWTTLINSESSSSDISQAVKEYRIIIRNLEIASDLEDSYFNRLLKTLPDMGLLNQITANPLDQIGELLPDKRDKIAWYSFFKKAQSDRSEQNFLYFGKWIGCQHEYDRLYQKFEDSNDSFPLGKRYTRLTPTDGVICGFCGATIRDDNDLTDQGYDASGQRVNTYDNDGLIRKESNIDLFLKKDKSEIIRSGEKLIEQWLDISNKTLTSRQKKAAKYEVLRIYEKVVLENKFYYGLQQNPNKLINVKKIPFGEFLVKKYAISNPTKFPNHIFLLKLFSFFYSLSSVYEIIMQRLAVFIVMNNSQMINEDPMYLNPSAILNMYTPEQIGIVFLNYNLKERAAILSLKDRIDKKKDNIFFDFFVEKAAKAYPKEKMTTVEYTKMLKEEYNKYRTIFLYTPNVVGQIFDGNSPLEHEIIRIYDEYQINQGNPTSLEYLSQHVNKYWKIWKDEHSTQIKRVEENARIAIIPQKGVLSNKVPRGVRPLYDRYLAQRKYILSRKLEQIYLDLINNNIHQISEYSVKNVTKLIGSGTGQIGGGGGTCPKIQWGSIESPKAVPCNAGSDPGQIVLKKMYLLNKLNCEDWENIDELGLIGLAEETQNIDMIIKYKEEISIIQNQMNTGNMAVQYWVNSGGFLNLEPKEREYTFFRGFSKPVDPVKEFHQEVNKQANEESNARIAQYPFTSFDLVDKSEKRVIPRIDTDDIAPANKMYRDINFLGGRPDKLVGSMGKINYLKEVEIFSCHLYQIINGQMNGSSNCNVEGKIESPYPEEEVFKKEFQEYLKNIYMDSKIQMLSLKKYIISYLRHHVYLMSRIKARKQMYEHSLDNYLELFDLDDFNDAFDKFNQEEDEIGRIVSNQEIENLVVANMDNYTKHPEIIRILQDIFISDVVRQLRLVKSRVGKFIKGQKKRKDDEPDSYEIFVKFTKILMSEIKEQDKVSNVDFYHLQINQMFKSKENWKKLNNAERKGEMEYKIMKYQLNISEFEEDFDGGELQTGIIDSSEDPNVGPGVIADAIDEWDDGELDMENDEDDYNDNDFDKL